MEKRRDQSPRDTGPESPPIPFHPDLAHREEVAGHLPGNRMVRVARNPRFRSLGHDTLLPRPHTSEPHDPVGRAIWRAKRLLLGEPIASDQELNERLSKIKALPVLSSDALSSVAYSVEATMRTLILAGVGALALTLPISIAIVLLLAIVATSYQQTVRAYPSGGGSYIVAHENLGAFPGLIAAASLLIGYILTAAVSIAAGVDALTSAFPDLAAWDMTIALGAVLLITVLNLRGVRESGTIFAFPTYVFIFSLLGMIAYGTFRLVSGGIPYQPVDPGPNAGTEALSLFLVLSAFSKGCSAMTGTEAISNAVPAFKYPEALNARITLMLMASLLAVMVIGIAFLVTQIGIVPDPSGLETVLSQVTRAVVGENWFFYVVQFATALILFLAANTSYAGFPWLLSVMARDHYVPHWLGLRGDRLAFTSGIMSLSALAAILIVAFGGNVERLLPLYAIGVFTAFTLSQSGMVVHWLRGREAHRLRSAIINGTGAVATGVATVVIGLTKFAEGAWLVVVVAPILMAAFALVNNHYRTVARQLAAMPAPTRSTAPPIVLVPVNGLNAVAVEAVNFARSLSSEVVAVHVASDQHEAQRMRDGWAEAIGKDVPLITIESHYRLVIQPLLAYVDAVRESEPNKRLLVVLPELVPIHWWEHLLHNQTALRLKAGLLFR
ncbi:MAG: APC family permease, partial [Chloroflexota bacterium]